MAAKPRAKPKRPRYGKGEALRRHAQQRKKGAFLDAFANTGIVRAAALAAGIDRGTHYLWLVSDSQYAHDFEEAQQDALEALEAEARRRAIERENHPGSDTLLIFLLKGAAPEKYRDRVSFDFSQYSDEALVAEGKGALARIEAARIAENAGPSRTDDSAA